MKGPVRRYSMSSVGDQAHLFSIFSLKSGSPHPTSADVPRHLVRAEKRPMRIALFVSLVKIPSGFLLLAAQADGRQSNSKGK